jgi:hypothetical protein
MKSYIFKYRKNLIWHKIKNVIGHKLEGNLMVIYLSNGGLRTIKNWDLHEMELGQDWVLWHKNEIEKQTGTNIKLAVDNS